MAATCKQARLKMRIKGQGGPEIAVGSHSFLLRNAGSSPVVNLFRSLYGSARADFVQRRTKTFGPVQKRSHIKKSMSILVGLRSGGRSD